MFAELGVVDHLVSGTLLALRLAPLVVLSPVLGLRAAPGMLRTAVLSVLVLALAPLAHANAELAPPSLLVAAATELTLGLAFATIAAAPFHALDLGGRLVDLGRGANLAEVLAPPTGERTSPSGDLALLAGLALFATLGGIRTTFGVLGESLVSMPLGRAPRVPVGVLLDGTVRLVCDALAFGVMVAMPALVAVFVADLALGLVGRAVPRVSTFFVAMPLRAVLGLFAFMLALGTALEAAMDLSRRSLVFPG